MSYQPLTRFLASCREREVPVRFEELERVLRRRLPDSARKHQAWWANTRTHSHAASWLSAGWRTARLDLAGERVVFVRELGEPAAPTDEDATRSVGKAVDSRAGRSVRMDPAGLTPLALARVRKHASETGSDLPTAAAELLDRFVVEERKQLLDWFAAHSPQTTTDSADLVRQDRDAR